MSEICNVKPKFYDIDVALAGGGAHSTPSEAISVAGLDYATIYLIGQGAAGASGAVTFYLSSSGDGTHYSTAGTPLTLKLDGANEVVSEPYVMDLRGINSLKILKIVNGDAGAVSGANALLTCVKQ